MTQNIAKLALLNGNSTAEEAREEVYTEKETLYGGWKVAVATFHSVKIECGYSFWSASYLLELTGCDRFVRSNELVRCQMRIAAIRQVHLGRE